MKASELRIGNLVYVKSKGEWVEVEVWDTLFCDINEDAAKVKPIPLTEEFLLKFGFDEVADDCDCWMISKNGQATYIDLIQGEFYYYLEVNTETSIIVKHVHQLQNLFYSLTGQELNTKK